MYYVDVLENGFGRGSSRNSDGTGGTNQRPIPISVGAGAVVDEDYMIAVPDGLSALKKLDQESYGARKRRELSMEMEIWARETDILSNFVTMLRSS